MRYFAVPHDGVNPPAVPSSAWACSKPSSEHRNKHRSHSRGHKATPIRNIPMQSRGVIPPSPPLLVCELFITNEDLCSKNDEFTYRFHHRAPPGSRRSVVAHRPAMITSPQCHHLRPRLPRSRPNSVHNRSKSLESCTRTLWHGHGKSSE